MFLQKLLARWDKFISNLLRLGWHTFSGGEGTSSVSLFYSSSNPSIAIIDANGKMRILTGYFAVHHHYDTDGKLTRRIPVRKEVRPGERLLVNVSDRQVYESTKHILRTGGMENR